LADDADCGKDTANANVDTDAKENRLLSAHAFLTSSSWESELNAAAAATAIPDGTSTNEREDGFAWL